jgi:hypothetical protein
MPTIFSRSCRYDTTRNPHDAGTGRTRPVQPGRHRRRLGVLLRNRRHRPRHGHHPRRVEAQTEQALQNLAAILQAAGAALADVVKTTIYYADVKDFVKLNEVYARHMPDPPPARSAPAGIQLPHGLLVSIEAIATLPAGRRSPDQRRIQAP